MGRLSFSIHGVGGGVPVVAVGRRFLLPRLCGRAFRLCRAVRVSHEGNAWSLPVSLAYEGVCLLTLFAVSMVRCRTVVDRSRFKTCLGAREFPYEILVTRRLTTVKRYRFAITIDVTSGTF